MMLATLMIAAVVALVLLSFGRGRGPGGPRAETPAERERRLKENEEVAIITMIVDDDAR